LGGEPGGIHNAACVCTHGSSIVRFEGPSRPSSAPHPCPSSNSATGACARLAMGACARGDGCLCAWRRVPVRVFHPDMPSEPEMVGGSVVGFKSGNQPTPNRWRLVARPDDVLIALIRSTDLASPSLRCGGVPMCEWRVQVCEWRSRTGTQERFRGSAWPLNNMARLSSFPTTRKAAHCRCLPPAQPPTAAHLPPPIG
jgi:hypothetical protein